MKFCGQVMTHHLMMPHGSMDPPVKPTSMLDSWWLWKSIQTYIDHWPGGCIPERTSAWPAAALLADKPNSWPGPSRPGLASLLASWPARSDDVGLKALLIFCWWIFHAISTWVAHQRPRFCIHRSFYYHSQSLTKGYQIGPESTKLLQK